MPKAKIRTKNVANPELPRGALENGKLAQLVAAKNELKKAAAAANNKLKKAEAARREAEQNPVPKNQQKRNNNSRKVRQTNPDLEPNLNHQQKAGGRR